MNTIRVVTFKEGDTWVAQCLERDIAVQAHDWDSLRGRIEVAIQAERPIERLPAAPQHFFDLWNRSSDTHHHSGKSDGIGYQMALCA